MTTATRDTRPAPTIRPPRTRKARRLTITACYPLILAVTGGGALWVMGADPVLAIAAAAVAMLPALILLGLAAVQMARSLEFNPWPPALGLLAVAVLAAWVGLPLIGLGWLRLVVLATAAAAVWPLARAWARYRRRRAVYNRCAQVLASVLGEFEQVAAALAEVIHRSRIGAPHLHAAPHSAWDLDIRGWRGERGDEPVQLIIRPLAQANITPDLEMAIRRALRTRVGLRVELSVNSLRDEITAAVRYGPEAEDTETSPEKAAAERAATALGQALKQKAVNVEVLEWDAEGMPEGAPRAWGLKRFRCSYEQTQQVTPRQVRENIRVHMGLQLFGDEAALRDDWDLGNDCVVFTRRNAFPDMIIHRPVDVEALFGGIAVLVHATDEDGHPVGWQLTETDAPHELVSGPTGTGKSVDNRTVAMEGARLGYDVRLVDPKRVEFRGLRGWPNVTVVATRVPDMIKVIDDLYDEMLQRYEDIETGAADESDFRTILAIIDEYLMFTLLVNDYWASQPSEDGGRRPKEHPVLRKIIGLLVLARGANIRFRVSTQRVDAALFSDSSLGGVRDSIAARCALGRQTQQGSQMMFGDSTTGRDIPLGSVGVGMILGPPGLVRAKMHWLPNPANWDKLSAEHRQLLIDMLPPGVTTWDGPLPYQPAESEAGDGEVQATPATRLLTIVRLALRVRDAHLTSAATGEEPATGPAAAYYGWALAMNGTLERCGKWIGSVEDTPAGRRVYLHPPSVMEVIERVAGPLGYRFGYSRAQLDTSLVQSGLLILEKEGGKNRNTPRRPCRGHDLGTREDRQRCWDLPAAEVLGDLPGEDGGNGAAPARVPRRPSPPPPAAGEEPPPVPPPAAGLPAAGPAARDYEPAAAAPAAELPARDYEPAAAVPGGEVPAGGYEAAAGTLPAGQLPDGQRILLIFDDDGREVVVTVDDVEDSIDMPGLLTINYGSDDGTPGSVTVTPGQPIRLARI